MHQSAVKKYVNIKRSVLDLNFITNLSLVNFFIVKATVPINCSLPRDFGSVGMRFLTRRLFNPLRYL